MFFSFLKDPIKENRGVFSETFSRHLLFVFRFLFFLSFFLFFFAQFQSPRIALDLKDGCAPERRVSVLFFCFFFLFERRVAVLSCPFRPFGLHFAKKKCVSALKDDGLRRSSAALVSTLG